MIPLSDSSRRPAEFPAVTVWLIAINVVVFGLELLGGDEFVLAWSATPAVIAAGRDWMTLLTAMFLHGGVVAFAAQIVIDPTSTIPNLGASGTVAAVIFGATSGGLFSRARVLDAGGPPWEPTTRFGRHL